MSNEQIPGTYERKSNTKVYYWNLIGEKWATKVDETSPGATPRMNKKNVKVFEKLEDGLRGKLRDINLRSGEYGEDLVIKLVPQQGYLHQISIPKESKYYRSFMEKMNSIDVKQEMEISVYNFLPKDAKDDKKLSGVTVKQNNNKLKSFYWDGTKNINGFPQSAKSYNEMTTNERKKWFLEIDDFFISELNNWRGQNAPDYQTEKEERFDSPKTDAPKSGKANAVTDEELAAGGIGHTIGDPSDLPF